MKLVITVPDDFDENEMALLWIALDRFALYGTVTLNYLVDQGDETVRKSVRVTDAIPYHPALPSRPLETVSAPTTYL